MSEQTWREVYIEQGATVGEEGEIVFPVEWVEAEAEAAALQAELEAEYERSEAMSSKFETMVRETLTAAGHGPVATDTHSGEGLIGFHTFKSGERIYVDFVGQLGQSHRVSDSAIRELRPGMLWSYARTLRDAGFCVVEQCSALIVTDPDGIAAEEEESERATRAWAGYVRTVEECGRKSVEAVAVLRRYNEVADRLHFLEYQARSLVRA